MKKNKYDLRSTFLHWHENYHEEKFHSLLWGNNDGVKNNSSQSWVRTEARVSFGENLVTHATIQKTNSSLFNICFFQTFHLSNVFLSFQDVKMFFFLFFLLASSLFLIMKRMSLNERSDVCLLMFLFRYLVQSCVHWRLQVAGQITIKLIQRIFLLTKIKKEQKKKFWKILWLKCKIERLVKCLVMELECRSV